MAVAGVLATALTDHAARRMALWVEGVDMVIQPGTGGNRVGTPIETVHVTHAGPGGVSSMEWTIEDPTQSVWLSDGAEVRLQDLVADVPLFNGYLQTWTITSDFGGQGRTFRCVAVGVEILLDWATIPTLTVLGSVTTLKDAIVQVAHAAIGIRDLRIIPASGISAPSTQATPIATFGSLTLGTAILAYDVALNGVSLREALRLVAQASIRQGSDYFGSIGSAVPALAQFTVDPWKGLRAMPDSAAGAWASDFVNLTVTDTVVSTIVAEPLEHTVDATGVVRGVYIIGTGAAGTGLAMDGTGLAGQIAVITDTTIDTAAKLADAQLAYLNAFLVSERGSLSLQDWTPVAGVVPGSLLILTDTATTTTGTYRIFQVEKTFTGARQNWTVAYGGLPPSAVAALRRQTRIIQN